MTSSVDGFVLDRVARNARLELSEAEKKRFLPEFEAVLRVFDELSELDVKTAEPAFTPTPVENVFREDVVRDAWPVETALSQTPHKKEPYFKGPKVVE